MGRRAAACFCAILTGVTLMHAGAQERWLADKADAWYRDIPWLVGCNFTPSNAINQLEMWQAETFDAPTIDRELGWMARTGMNAARVYLHLFPWERDSAAFTARIERFLSLADRHNIRVMFVLLDDCWNTTPKAGKQPKPVPGVHNSGWVQCPGKAIVDDRTQWPRVRSYVTGLLRTFSRDPRVLCWDLYNEPGNTAGGERSFPLLKETFRWAREASPSQPVTAGIYEGMADEFVKFLETASDITTFHNYSDTTALVRDIRRFKALGRPVLCTEWMARTNGSRIPTHLPIFKRENVGCFIWGAVEGKTQTIFPWESKPGTPRPAVWFHDLLRRDGKPFDPAETDLIRELTGTRP